MVMWKPSRNPMKTRRTSLFVPLILAAFTMLLRGKDTPAPAGESSVRPGINANFLDPALKVDEFLQRFEVESREIFHERDKVVAACGIQKGMTVADIGAGTGLYSRLFAEATGPHGWVYAVEIAGPFLRHIVQRAQQEGQKNISAVLSPENSVSLPPDSVDVAFICDTYHHFEYPKSTMESLASALKNGGTLIVIDFERVEGKSSDWVMGHVRAGKEVFRQEIEEAGLKFVEEVEMEGFKENYILRFRKE
jgi:ubiquinone/menaquinone biosynthesis C-methylase UbiE